MQYDNSNENNIMLLSVYTKELTNHDLLVYIYK